MSKPRSIELQFPMAGQVKRSGYQRSDPYSTEDCSNVRPRDTLETRERGGSRPGTTKAMATQLNSGAPIQMLEPVTVIGTDGTTEDVMVAVAGGRAYSSTDWGAFNPVGGGTVLNPGFETSGIWSEALGTGTIARSASVFHEGAYSCALTTGLSGDTRVYQVLTLTASARYRLSFWTKGTGALAGRYSVYAGAPVSESIISATSTGVTAATWTQVIVEFTNKAGTSVTIYLWGPSSAGGPVYFDDISVYLQPTLNAEALTLNAASLGQKMYIADYRSTRLYGTDGTIAGTGTDELSATSVADWSALSIDTELDTILLTGVAATSAQDAVYPIASVDAAHIHVTGTLTAGTCSWELGRQIKIYDPSTGALTALTPTYGIAPLNCRLICSYRDRLVVVVENTWYMSAQGDPLDWDYFTDDPENPGRAFYSGNEDAGKVPHPITALISHSDDYLIFGAEHSLWMLKGDPGYGGQVDPLSYEVGIVGPNAWCKTAESDLVFLSRDGVYVLPAGGQVPQQFSRERLPAELLDVNMETNAVSMAWDQRGQGCWLFITPIAGTAGTAWWIDWPTKSFWPVSIPAVQQPRCMVAYAPDVGEERHVLLGCYNGYVRRFSDSATTDDGTAITSYVKIGPLRTGSPGHDGILSEIAADLDESSGSVTWELMGGDTAEAASASTTVRATGTWAAGRNVPSGCRVRAAAVCLKISATTRWAFESAVAVFAPGGRIR